jgi:NTE family protein
MNNKGSELATVLKTSRLFTDLSSETVSEILGKCKILYLNTGEVLFNQGDKSDSVCLLISGKLLAKLVKDEEIQSIGTISTGEMFGELGVLSGQPRSLTIQAIENSEVLFIAADVFKNLFDNNLSVCVATSRPVIRHAFDNLKFAIDKNKTRQIVILPADTNLPLDIIYERFSELAANHTHVLFLHEKNFIDLDIDTIKQKTRTLEQEREIVVYFLNSRDSNFARMVINEAQTICFLVNKQVNEDFYDLSVKTVLWQKQHSVFRKELIIVENKYSLDISLPFKNLGIFDLYHKIRLDDDPSIARVLRFIAGKAIGLVLSGGGIRGFAHVGAIKAINELKIPIDIVGGTSAGALVGGLHAMGLCHDEIEEKFAELVTASSDALFWRNITLPILVFFNGSSITKALQRIFKDINIENLLIPYFCASCNISTNQVSIHKHGNMFSKVRASISIPGLIPPMVIDGQMHVDGSMLKHLPVDAMKETLGNGSSKIIALLVPPKTTSSQSYNFPPTFTFMQSLLYSLGINKKKYIIPSFSESFLQAVAFSSDYDCAINADIADILVNLGFQDTPLLRISKKNAKKMIAASYDKTLGILSKYYPK